MKDKYLDKLKEEKYYKSWIKIVEPIVYSREFQKRKKMKHHDDSVYAHCISVSFIGYGLAMKKKKDREFCSNVAIAGLLHDFYTRAWQYSETLKEIDDIHSARFNDKKNNKDLHGFTHAKDALNNAKKYYPEFMNKRIENAILRHMFPLTIIPPKYKEGWYITKADKISTVKHRPKVKDYPKYVGLGNKKHK